MEPNLKIVSAIVIFIFITGFAGAVLIEATEHKILVVNSYDEGMMWEQDIQRGIVDGLAQMGYIEGQNYELRTFNMDTKVNYTTEAEIEQRAKIALDLIDNFQPDIVFVNDDNALRYVAVAYTENNPDANLPFVFSGANGDPSIYDPIESLEVPGGPITGALERLPYYDGISLGKAIVPNATKIVIFADFSPSSDLVASTFQERYLDRVKDSPLEVIDYIQIETFEEWKLKVSEYQEIADIIGIVNYYQLKDVNGRVVPSAVVANWTIHNSDLPEIGFIANDVKDGILAAAGISYYMTGVYVGGIGAEIIKGRDPATIPIIDPEVVDIGFNLERADMLGIEIPATELAKATVVL
jgi:putative ABC transport system substrate-binding protein